MNVADLGPGHRQHFAGGIEFHCARTERNHRAIECQIFVREATDIAQHFGFGMVLIEHRMREIGRFSRETRGERIGQRRGIQIRNRKRRIGIVENMPQFFDVAARRCLIQRKRNNFRIHFAKIEAMLHAAFHDAIGGIAGFDDKGIEVMRQWTSEAEFLQSLLRNHRQAMRAFGYTFQSGWAVVDRVHARHHREQYLRGTNIRGRFFTADMLLARLQREA